jgi:hypothetical protein
MKLEFEADEMVCLNSKTYIAKRNAQNENIKEKIKMAIKGLSHSNKPTVDDFVNVLNSQTSISGKNYGFRLRKNQMLQYSQVRSGITYLYIKMKVLDDHITCVPLDI